MGWLILIKEHKNGEAFHQLGPFYSIRLAEKAEAGLNRNMDHNKYYSEIVEEQPSMTETETNKE